MNASATGTGLNRTCLIMDPNARPITAAGMNATARFRQSDGSTLKNRARYSQTTASMAPVWMATKNTPLRASL